MTRLPSQFRDDARFRILRLLEEHPQMTQRQIADTLGISLGGVNYCLRGLVERMRPVKARFQAFSGCQFHGMSSSMRLIL